jgi:hypothetical protein
VVFEGFLYALEKSMFPEIDALTIKAWENLLLNVAHHFDSGFYEQRGAEESKLYILQLADQKSNKKGKGKGKVSRQTLGTSTSMSVTSEELLLLSEQATDAESCRMANDVVTGIPPVTVGSCVDLVLPAADGSGFLTGVSVDSVGAGLRHSSNPPVDAGLRQSLNPPVDAGLWQSSNPVNAGLRKSSNPPVNAGLRKSSNPPVNAGLRKSSNPPVDAGLRHSPNPPSCSSLAYAQSVRVRPLLRVMQSKQDASLSTSYDSNINAVKR